MTTDMATFIRTVRTNGNDSWGNVFLTSDWTLYVDMTSQQHDLAMARLGIDRNSVLLSGFVHDGTIGWRSSPGVDSREISVKRSIELMRAIEKQENLR